MPPTAKGLSHPSVGSLGRVYTHLPEVGSRGRQEIARIPLAELDAKLAGVRGRIGRTDALIDQVVYRLYGLTEEEVKVVAGG